MWLMFINLMNALEHVTNMTDSCVYIVDTCVYTYFRRKLLHNYWIGNMCIDFFQMLLFVRLYCMFAKYGNLAGKHATLSNIAL